MAQATAMPRECTPEGWDGVAAVYNSAVSDYCKDAATLSGLAGLPDDKRSSTKVLDVACGPGGMAIFAAELLKGEGNVLATDFSPKMIEQCELNVKALGLKNVESKIMDGQALGLEDNSFDFVYCIFGVMFYPDKAKGLKELQRVLAPNGRAVIAVWSRTVGFLKALGAVKEAAQKRFGISTSSAPPSTVASLADPEYFEAELKKAGFTKVDIHKVEHSFTFESREQVARYMASNPVTHTLIQSLGISEKDWSDVAHEVLMNLFPSPPCVIPGCVALVAVLQKD